MAGSDTWWILVVVFRPWSWDAHQSGSELSCWAWRWQSCRWSRVCAAAEQARLELLVGSEPAGSEIHRPTVRDRYSASYQAAIVSPVEAEPRPVFPRLVLYVSRLVELFVVIDAEWGDIASASIPGGTAPAPPSCGLKNREVTLEKTNRALNPWKLGTLTRPATAGILELCHSIGKVSGVLPNTPKS